MIETSTISVMLRPTADLAMLSDKSRSARATELMVVIGRLALKTVKAKMTIRTMRRRTVAMETPMQVLRRRRERMDLGSLVEEEEAISMADGVWILKEDSDFGIYGAIGVGI